MAGERPMVVSRVRAGDASVLWSGSGDGIHRRSRVAWRLDGSFTRVKRREDGKLERVKSSRQHRTLAQPAPVFREDHVGRKGYSKMAWSAPTTIAGFFSRPSRRKVPRREESEMSWRDYESAKAGAVIGST